MKFYKYHGLGNDYIVIDANETDIALNASITKLLCHRNYGIGSDGILLGHRTGENSFALRIFNPDGSEAEESGNGLRIYSRFLWDKGRVKSNEFTINTAGGEVRAQILQDGKLVKVQMGKVSFQASTIPVLGEKEEVIHKDLQVNTMRFNFNAVSVGNPHCVIIMEEISPDFTKKWGPQIENNGKFPNRTNVQFMKVIDKSHIQIEIWERGAGYTLASGSSSIAAAAVAFKTGLCEKDITVKMQGGELDVCFDYDFNATMSGPVCAVCDGELKKDIIEEIKKLQ